MMELDLASEAAAEGSRRARRLVTARAHPDSDPDQFTATLRQVLLEVDDDPQALAYLIVGQATVATVALIAASRGVPVTEVMAAIFGLMERDERSWWPPAASGGVSPYPEP